MIVFQIAHLVWYFFLKAADALQDTRVPSPRPPPLVSHHLFPIQPYQWLHGILYRIIALNHYTDRATLKSLQVLNSQILPSDQDISSNGNISQQPKLDNCRDTRLCKSFR